MEAPDRQALALAGGQEVRLSILPTAAAPDHNDRRAGMNGYRWFSRLGAKNVEVLGLVGAASANDANLASALRLSRFIYLLGGFPHYLGQTLKGSACWQAAVEAYQAGAVIGGSSAGAMVLCEHYYDPDSQTIQEGLNLIAQICFIPHHNTFGKGWAVRLQDLLPEDIFIGVDEQTGLIDDGPDRQWQVYGKGVATIYQAGEIKRYSPGEAFKLAKGY